MAQVQLAPSVTSVPLDWNETQLLDFISKQGTAGQQTIVGGQHLWLLYGILKPSWSV